MRLGDSSASLWAAVPHYVAPAAVPESDPRAARPARGRCSRSASRWGTSWRRPRRGSVVSRSSQARTARSRSTSRPSSRHVTPVSCPRRPAMRSLASSSATSSAVPATPTPDPSSAGFGPSIRRFCP
ncbi:MAG: hypothetical protein WKF83_04975 [Nocardioidaceae bacterium]